MNSIKKVSFLATGDEIICGQTINTNTPALAEQLIAAGIEVGNHATATDEEHDIVRCIQFLLESHEALIIIGGLGPTSDDRTRQALATAINEPLVFDPPSWDYIVDRLQSKGLSAPESNKQQAYFPKDAHIIENLNGTARGCHLTKNNKFIFMLPGPPAECIPMFDSLAISLLKENGFVSPRFFKNWMLLGVSEGHLSEQLDKIPLPPSCRLGYRIQRPYLEIKVYARVESEFHALVKQVEPFLKDYIVDDEKPSAL